MNKKEFSFTEIDEEGYDTLNILSATNNFNNWIYNTIKPFLQGEILEIGSGIGNITQCVINNKLTITASDVRNHYCQTLKDRLKSNTYLKGVKNIDIVHPDFKIKYSDLLGTFDTVISINIIEHIENDTLAIQNCRELLKENGNLVILVPAYSFLYNRFDKELRHFKRYNATTLSDLFTSGYFKIEKIQYFNFIGILGWWFSGSILKKKTIPEGQMKIFNMMVPLFKFIDKLIGNRMGLSVVGFAKKNNGFTKQIAKNKV